MSNSVILSFLASIFKYLFIKIKESYVVSLVFKFDSFLRRSIKKSFIFSLFSSKDDFDAGYKMKISDRILSFRESISKKLSFINKWFNDSSVNNFLKNINDNFMSINASYYGIFLSIIGAFSVFKYAFLEYDLFNIIISLIILIIGMIFIIGNTSIKGLLTGSFVLSKVLSVLGIKFEADTVIECKKLPMIICGIIFGIIVMLCGLVPALLPIILLFAAYWAFSHIYAAVVAAVFVLPFFPTMAMVALSLGLVFITVIRKLFSNDNELMSDVSIMNYALPVYLVSLIFGTVFSYSVTSSMKISMVYVAFVIFYFVIVKSIKNENQLIKAVYAVVFSSIPVSVYGIIQKITGFDNQNKWLDANMFESIKGRVVSFFGNPNVFGEYLIWLVIISLSVFIATENKKLKVAFGIAFISSVISMVFTYSRGCWIGVVLAVIVYLFMTNRKVFWSFVFLGIVSIFFLPDSIISRISSVGDMADTSTSYRVYIWKGTFEMLKTYWPTGVGLGSDAFNEVYPAFAYSAINAPHPHNLYLLIFSETGIMGAIGFLFVTFIYYKNMIKTFMYTNKKMFKSLSAAFIAAMTGYLVQGLFDNVWYNYRIYMLYWIFIALSTSIYLIGTRNVANDENC